MRAPRSKAVDEMFRDKEATARFYTIAREGRSGVITSAGRTFKVEPVGRYISRLAARKRKEQ